MFSKPDKVMVAQGQYKAFAIGSDLPYQIFEAYPLISCFAFLFQYAKKKDEKKGILYHAPVGILEEKPLNEIIELIKKESELSQIKIIITPSGEDTTHALEQTKEKLQSSGFTSTPIINTSARIYCADTLGNHGVIVSRKSVVEAEVKPKSPPSPSLSSDSDDDLP